MNTENQQRILLTDAAVFLGALLSDFYALLDDCFIGKSSDLWRLENAKHVHHLAASAFNIYDDAKQRISDVSVTRNNSGLRSKEKGMKNTFTYYTPRNNQQFEEENNKYYLNNE